MCGSPENRNLFSSETTAGRAAEDYNGERLPSCKKETKGKGCRRLEIQEVHSGSAGNEKTEKLLLFVQLKEETISR